MAVGANFHLILKTRVVFDVLARHADVVCDLVNLVAFFGPGKDARSPQSVGGWMVGIVRIDVPFVFLHLFADPLLPAAA